MALEVTYENFQAVHDLMSKKLRVNGLVIVAHGGVHVDLREHEGAQGFNEKDLILDLVFTVTAEDPSEQPVDFEQAWEETGIQYTSVSFMVRGEEEVPPPETVPVQTVR